MRNIKINLKKNNERSCLPCTACCEGWLNISEFSVQAQIGQPCMHCTLNGCGVYQDRPVDPCRTFFCAWRQQNTPIVELMRPDLSGVIVVMDRLTWREDYVIVGIPTAEHIPEKSLNYLMGLSRLTGQNLLTVRFIKDAGKFTGTSMLSAYGDAAFVEEMKVRFQDGKLIW